MSNPPPAFQFYAERFVAGTDGLTTAEIGGYILLLCYQWRYGAVPGESMKRLGAIMRCGPNSARSIWASLRPKFTRTLDGVWRNDRLEEVRAEQQDYTTNKRVAGKKGAVARWQKHGTAIALPSENEPKTDGTDMALSTQRVVESKNDSTTGHTPRELFDVHQRLFVERYGQKPAYDNGKDASTLKKLIQKHGFPRAVELLTAYFASRDPWIAGCGHGLGPFASATVQNKLIAELSGRAPRSNGGAPTRPVSSEQRQQDQRMAEVKRLMRDEGLTRDQAVERVFP